MNIIGKWKVKKVGIFDEENGMQMKTVDEIMVMDETEDVIQAKEMAETTLIVSENGTMSIRMVIPPYVVEEAKAAGEEIPFNEDGTVTVQEFEWKEENGEIFYNLGDEGEIDGEPIDPWIKAEYDEDGLLVLAAGFNAGQIERMRMGESGIEVGFVWSDLITNMERVSDHCSNIAGCVIDTKEQNMNLHKSLKMLRTDSEFYREKYTEYTKKYLSFV